MEVLPRVRHRQLGLGARLLVLLCGDGRAVAGRSGQAVRDQICEWWFNNLPGGCSGGEERNESENGSGKTRSGLAR